MLIGTVCSAAVNSKPVEDREIKRCDKVAVRSSADGLLSELKAETSSYPAPARNVSLRLGSAQAVHD